MLAHFGQNDLLGRTTALQCGALLAFHNRRAQLVEASLGAEFFRGVADLAGSFCKKTVKCSVYWCFQFTEPSGKLHQFYVGPDSAEVQKLVSKKKEPASSASQIPLARSDIALGCMPVLPRHYRVIRRLADYGFFKAGGVLIGTHAFLAYGNTLGQCWGGQDRTQDIDFAHAGKRLSLLLPNNVEVKTNDAIESLAMGFVPVAALSGKTGGTYLIPSEPEFRLDFLTPLHRGGDEPYNHSQLHITLQPLPFMEFSLESVEQSVLFCAEGAVLVNVPSPERFALHKLVVHGEGSGVFRTKSSKDLLLSVCLLDYLWSTRPYTLEKALDDFLTRGPGWVIRLKRGVNALYSSDAELKVAHWLEERLPE